MKQRTLKQSLAGLIPGVRSLQDQRDHFARLTEDLTRRLATTEAALQDAKAVAQIPPLPPAAPVVPTHHFKGYDIPVDLMKIRRFKPAFSIAAMMDRACSSSWHPRFA